MIANLLNFDLPKESKAKKKKMKNDENENDVIFGRHSLDEE